MKNFRTYFLIGLILACCTVSTNVKAQIPINYPPDSIPTNDNDLLSLQQLMDIKVTVASEKELTIKESPAVVTLITAEELKNSGARDFMDVIKLVTGFDFGLDVDNVISLGVRGNWGQESKVLLTIEGQLS